MNWPIHLYAIVSADDCIADADGNMPKALMNDADWQTFQAELDTCRMIILGRRSHEATPNGAGRLRVILTRSVDGLHKREDGWWWNPHSVSFAEMAARVAPGGGKVGVPGGQEVFGHFLAQGMDAFHLTRAKKVYLPNGRKVFAGPASAEKQLGDAGLVPDHPKVLDGENAIELTVWRKQTREEQP